MPPISQYRISKEGRSTFIRKRGRDSLAWQAKLSGVGGSEPFTSNRILRDDSSTTNDQISPKQNKHTNKKT